VQQEKQALTNQIRVKNAEALIDQRMVEFSSLGIDLSQLPCGDDPTYTRRYNEAQAKMDEVSALIHAYSLEAKYHDFCMGVLQYLTDLGVWSGPDECS
jgi:hypothetical protein